MDGYAKRSIRHTSQEVEAAAKSLRATMTPAERRLWEALRWRRLDGLRFRAQHPVGRFILDFYCPARRLVVEVDGSSHEGRSDQDEARTVSLEAHGYRIVRCTNRDVLNNLPTVLRRIREAAADQATKIGRPQR